MFHVQSGNVILMFISRSLRSSNSPNSIRERESINNNVCLSGHGKLVDPPGRNTVMNTQRGGNYLKQCNNGDINYSDKSNFCGGKGVSN